MEPFFPGLFRSVEVCIELRYMIVETRAKRVYPPKADSRTIPNSLKLSSNGGCQMTENERSPVIKQSCEARGLANIHMKDANLLVQFVGPVICSYYPGGYNMAFISSAELLTPYLVAAEANMSPPTSAR